MDIADIRDKYNNGGYTYHMEIPARVKDNHVFDENLSVKRNREMVAEHNQKVEDMKRKKMAVQEDFNRRFSIDVVTYIVDSYDMSVAQAKIVERFVYNNFHSAMCDYFSNIDEVAEMVERVIEEGFLESK